MFLSYESYEKNRDNWYRANEQRNFPNFNEWILSNPWFAIDPRFANSGPGYNIVADGSSGRFRNLVTGESGLTHEQAVAIMRRASGITVSVLITESNPTDARPDCHRTPENGAR